MLARLSRGQPRRAYYGRNFLRCTRERRKSTSVVSKRTPDSRETAASVSTNDAAISREIGVYPGGVEMPFTSRLHIVDPADFPVRYSKRFGNYILRARRARSPRLQGQTVKA